MASSVTSSPPRRPLDAPSGSRRWLWLGLAAAAVAVIALLWPRDRAPSKVRPAKAVTERRNPFGPRLTLGPNGWQYGARRSLGPIAPRPVADGLVRVTGTVFDQANHKVVGDVEVVFADGNTEASAVADVAGRYSIDLPAGRYRPFVRGDGLISASVPVRERLPARPGVDEVAAARLELAFAIDVRRNTDGVDLEVVRSGKVRGRVVDRAGNPITGAVVRAFATDEPTTPRPILGTDVAETGADGSFELEVASATYRLDAFHDRYGGVASTEVVYVEPAGTASAELVMAAGCVISGRVVRADGRAPTSGAIERSYGLEDGDGFFPDGEFSEDGTFQWTTTTEMTVQLRAWPWKSTHSQARRFECRDGARYDNVVFEIPSAAPDLQGRVVTADGRPIPYAYVDIGGLSEGTMNQQERADAEGYWAVYALPPGQYRVTAQADAAGMVARTVTSPAADVELRMSGTGTLTGKVAGITDGAFTLEVYGCSDGGGDWGVAMQMRRVVPVAGGVYTLDAVPACATMHVGVRHRSHRVVLETTVPAGGVTTLDIDVADPEPVTVRGVVRGPDGRGVPHAMISAVSSDGDASAFVEADDSGRFQLEAHAGDQLAARGPEGGFGLRWIDRGAKGVIDLDVEVDAGDVRFDDDQPDEGAIDEE